MVGSVLNSGVGWFDMGLSGMYWVGVASMGTALASGEGPEDRSIVNMVMFGDGWVGKGWNCRGVGRG
eukprot:757275-Hanusia_phi.AAC.1